MKFQFDTRKKGLTVAVVYYWKKLLRGDVELTSFSSRAQARP